MSVLVDTSVWMSYFASGRTQVSASLETLIGRGEDIAITPVILLEVLQGARSLANFDAINQRFSSLLMLLPLSEPDSSISAARIYARCRWSGVTPGSSINCVIAQAAIEHNMPLLQNDNDFKRIATVVPELKLI